MKVYKSIYHVAVDHKSNIENKFKIAIADAIMENQEKEYQSEIQYSTCADSGTVVYSALILAYKEE